jgi:hypothetical protein
MRQTFTIEEAYADALETLEIIAFPHRDDPDPPAAHLRTVARASLERLKYGGAYADHMQRLREAQNA